MTKDESQSTASRRSVSVKWIAPSRGGYSASKSSSSDSGPRVPPKLPASSSRGTATATKAK